MAGIYGKMSISPKPRGGALPVYQGASGVYVSGADMSARLSDSASRLFGSAREESSKAWGNVARAANNAVQTGIAAYEDYSKSKATQLLDEYRRRVREAMYGENGILTRKGEAAFTADSDVAARSQEIREDVLGEYKDSLAGNFFAMRARDVDADNVLAAQKYKGNEFRTWQNRNDLAAVQEATDRALAHYNDFEQFGKATAEALWHMRERLTRDGYSGEALDRELKELSSGIFKGGIAQALAADDLSGARRLLAEGAKGSGRMTTTDIAVSKAGIKSHAKALEARARAERERADAARVAAMSASVWENTKGLPWEERNEAAIESIAAMTEDPKERRELYAAYERDAAFQKIREDAAAGKAARELAEDAFARDILPGEFMAELDRREDIDPKTRARAVELFRGDVKESPKNRAALRDLRAGIDNGVARSVDDVEAFAFNHGLTPSQTKDALSYLEGGGKTGGLTQTKLDRMWKNATGGRAPDDLYEWIRGQLPDGKKPTDKDLEELMAKFAMKGITPGSGLISDSETYLDALRNRRGNDWLPDLSSAEYREISGMLRARGLPYTRRDAQEWKRREVLGLAYQPTDIDKALGTAAMATRILSGEKE